MGSSASVEVEESGHGFSANEVMCRERGGSRKES